MSSLADCLSALLDHVSPPFGRAAWLIRNSLPTSRPFTAALAADDLGFYGDSSGTRARRNLAVVRPGDDCYTEQVLVLRGDATNRRTTRGRFPIPGVEALPGQVSETEWRQAEEFARQTSARCAPWVFVVLAPQIRRTENGHTFKGVAHTPEDGSRSVIAVSVQRSLEDVRNAVHHELWHQIEAKLSQESLITLRDALSPYGYSAGLDAYNNATGERLARAYSCFALQCDDLGSIGETVPWNPANARLRPVFDAFRAVYSGEYARMLRQHGAL